VFTKKHFPDWKKKGNQMGVPLERAIGLALHQLTKVGAETGI
jgi:hypothetical protein